MPTHHMLEHEEHSLSNTSERNHCPLIRIHAKKLQEQVNSFLIDFDFNISRDEILPKCSTLMLLRCTHEEVEDTDDRDQDQDFHHLLWYDKKMDPCDKHRPNFFIICSSLMKRANLIKMDQQSS